MNRITLRLRLLIVWAVFIAITLQVAGIGLRVLFERSITRRTQAELEADVRQLRRGMEVQQNGAIRIVREPTDPQFDIVFGGRYWQVDEGDTPIAKSRSLDDLTLAPPKPDAVDSERNSAWISGPEGEHLFAVVSPHIVPAAEGSPERKLQLMAAVDATEIEEDTNRFASDLFNSLLGLAVLLLAGAWLHVTFGLRPLKTLQGSVAAVRKGNASRIDGEFPAEVMPLVSETNALLEAQELVLQDARARAGDLAHGLKTPLAVMAANGRTLRRRGIYDVADEIDRQIEVMRRHVDRELARARARGVYRLGQKPTDIAKLLHELVEVIDGLPHERPISWTLDVTSPLLLSADSDDFNNIAGNLLENAAKWATKEIRVELHPYKGGARMIVEDDGSGIPEDQHERVLRRGERADTSMPGSGLGLAIVNDLVSLYRGQLTLGRGQLGGLKVDVILPDAVSQLPS